MAAGFEACLIDAYGTIVHTDFSAQRAELPVMAGIPADVMYAEFGRLALRQADPDGAEHQLLARDQERGFAVVPVHRSDELLRVDEGIRVRNACRILGDATVVRELRDRFGVLEARRAQHEQLGLEDGNTALAEGFRWSVVQQCHDTGSAQATRGSRLSRLPLKEPDWVRRFDWDAGGPRIGLPFYSAAASVVGITDT